MLTLNVVRWCAVIFCHVGLVWQINQYINSSSISSSLGLLGFSKLLAMGNDTHEEGKNIKNTCKKAWKIVSHNKL